MTQHALSQVDDGTRRTVQVGDSLLVRLPENGGTGFLWQLDLPAGVRLVDEGPEPAPLAAGVGGTGLHRFQLLVQAPGRHRVTGRLAQPWAPETVDASWTVELEAEEALR